MANVIEIVAKGKDLTTSTFRKMGRGITNSLKGAVGSVFSLRGAVGVLAGTAGVGALVKSFVDAASTTEDFRTRLVSLTKSEEIAEQKLRALSAFAAKAPFELPQIIEAGITLEAFGAKAEDTIAPLGDLAAFMGIEIKEASAAFGRAFAAGAGAADVLRERGVLALISMQTGISDLTKLTLPEFRKAMLDAMTDPDGKIFGATAKLAETFTGQVSMMSDALFRMRNTIGDALLPTMKDLVTNHIIPLINRIGEWAKQNQELIKIKVREFVLKIIEALKSLSKMFLSLVGETENWAVSLLKIKQISLLVAAGILKLAKGAAFLGMVVQDMAWVLGLAEKNGDSFKIAIANLERQAKDMEDTGISMFKEMTKESLKFSESLLENAKAAKETKKAIKDISKERKEGNDIIKKAITLSKQLAAELSKLSIRAKKAGKSRLELLDAEEKSLLKRLELEKASGKQITKAQADFAKLRSQIIEEETDKKENILKEFTKFNLAQLERMLNDEQITADKKELIWEVINKKIEKSQIGLFDAFRLGMEDTIEKFKSQSQLMLDAGINLANTLRDGFSDLFFDFFDSSITDMTESWEKFGDNLSDVFFRTLSDMAAQLVASEIFSFFFEKKRGIIQPSVDFVGPPTKEQAEFSGAQQAQNSLKSLIPTWALIAITTVAAVNSGVIEDLVEGLVSAIEKLPEIFRTFVKKLPNLIRLLAKALPDIIKSLIGALPEIIDIIILNI